MILRPAHMHDDQMDMTKRHSGFGRNVIVAGIVSFFMDFSSERIYPLVPLFLSDVLGSNPLYYLLVSQNRVKKEKHWQARWGTSGFKRPLPTPDIEIALNGLVQG